MRGLWKTWMTLWCGATIGFGLILAGAAFPATDGLARFYYGLISAGALAPNFLEAPGFRFSVAVLGAVMIGWGMTILALVRVADAAPSASWWGLTASMLIWFAIDSGLSITTGFPLNALSNSVFLILYLIPVIASGVLKSSARTAHA